MYQTVKDRLLLFIDAIGISIRQFEIASGLSCGYLKNVTSQPSTSKIEKILEAFPQLNRVWLLAGHGEMLNDAAHTATQTVGDNSVAVNNNASTISAPITAGRSSKAAADMNMARALSIVEEAQRILAKVVETNAKVVAMSEQQQAALLKQSDALLDILKNK